MSAITELAALRLTTDLMPLGGPGSPIAPPTYAGSSDSSNETKFALSENVQIPGTTERGTAVVVDSIPAQAHKVSLAMKRLIEEITGKQAPGLYVGMPDDDTIAKAATSAAGKKLDRAYVESELRMALADTLAGGYVSSWTASHRHADASLRHADDPATGKQVWAGGDIGELIRSLRATEGTVLAKTVPNAAILGFWLSARSPRRHRLARSLTSEVVGYGAVPVYRGMTKGCVFDGVSATEVLLRLSDTNELDVATGKTAAAPSTFGFGQIPGDVDPRAVSCELIRRQSVVSVQSLRAQLRDGSDPLAAETLQVLADLALLSTAEATEGFFRSGTDLVPLPDSASLVGVGADGATVELDLGEELTAARERLTEVVGGGDWFAEPVELRLSAVEATLIAGRIVNDALSKDTDKESEQ